jgi:hypothetical protein
MIGYFLQAVITKGKKKATKAKNTNTTTKALRGPATCKRCGGLGHYAKTCKQALDETLDVLDSYEVKP